ncbi:MAG: hypothetical protein JWR37_4352 [Mycobacterium sp.]|nr:hypothetical protein [Mycobacterium sp.]
MSGSRRDSHSGSHRSRRDILSSPASCHPVHKEPCTHAQWAKSRGCWLVMRCQHAVAFLVARSRLYLLRIQRITKALMRDRSGYRAER